MRLLVIGSTGLLGQALVAEAQSRSYEIITAARSGADLSLDVAEDEGLQAAVASVEPDALINCTALTSVDECERDPGRAYRVNARPLAFLASWSREAGRPLVHISTDHFFTDGEARRHSERDPVNLVNEYARSKFAGEAFALTAPLALVLRTNIVGIRGWERPTFAEWAIRCIQRAEPMTLFENSFVSSIDVQTFARAALDLLERGATGLLNVASSQVFTKGDFIRALADALDTRIANARERSVTELHPPRPASLGLDVSAAEQRLGYRLPDLQTVAASVVRQYKDRADP